MTTRTRDITDLTPAELRTLLQQPLDPATRNALRAETRRRAAATPPRPAPPGPPPLREGLYPPAQVAAHFGVTAKTVTRWAKAGKLTAIRTLGGHRRYHATEVNALLNMAGTPPAQPG